MAYKTITCNSVQNLSNGLSAAIIGKYGAISTVGKIPAIANSYAIVNANATFNGDIQFTIANFDNFIDDNFNTHILQVNTGNVFQGLKGNNFVTIPISEKTNTEALYGFVGYNTVLTDYSGKIKDIDISNNVITIENIRAGDIDLVDSLPDPPFFVNFSQIIDPVYFSNNSLYVAGYSDIRQRTYNVSSQTSGLYTADICVPAISKEFLSVYIDGIEQEQASFSFDGLSNVTVTLGGTEKEVKVLCDYYTTPIIEVGDNISISAQNVYSVIETSYSQESANYNVALTANTIYKIRLKDTLRSNLVNAQVTNISPDILGIIGNVNSSLNTFTIDYNSDRYPGNFSLANNRIYKVAAPATFNPITLEGNRVLRNVPTGLNIVRARNVNTSGRRSPWAQDYDYINHLPITKVQNLLITEKLLKDTSQGVVIRVEVSFDVLINQDVTDYEISYKLDGESVDTTSYNTVKVPSVGADSTGKIRYIIANIERGRTAGINSITVRVTGLNNDIRGITTEKTQSIIGKSAAPQNIENLTGGQSGTEVFFSWKFPVNNDGSLIDIDLLETIIKRASGTISSSNYEDIWVRTATLEKVATPATSVKVPISSYGTYTYLFKTRDTSYNDSAGITGITLSLTRPSDSVAYRIYSEDEPSANTVVSGKYNNNYFEVNYPSFSDSNTFGLSYEYTSAVDNANGASSGWTLSGSNDMISTANSVYQTQIRDIGSNVIGTIVSAVEGSVSIGTTFNELRSTVLSGVSEISTNSTIFIDTDFNGIGHILGYANANAATASYGAINKTLISGGISGNVYAIWNDGQFVGDTANTNSYALIAGVINANAIALGNTFYANGQSTGSNSLANLTTSAASYKLVNLQQFNDDTGQITFAGQENLITTNVQIRYTTNNPYYANGNVNVATFIDSENNNGWKTIDSTDKTFRYIQLRLDVKNTNPSLTVYTLDKFNYVVNLKDKIDKQTVNIVSTPTTIDYSSIGYVETPFISLTMLNTTSPYNPVIVNPNNSNARINVLSNTGSAVTNVQVIATIIGV